MKRRSLLKGAAAAALSATFPSWIRSAYAADACDTGKAVSPAKGLVTFSQGFRAAQRSGRPLLVLVIPTVADNRWQPGQAFGELFNNATPEQLLPFAMVEIVAAKMKVVRTLVPTAPEGEPMMVLIDTDRSPAQARALDVKLVFDYPRFGDDKTANKLIDDRVEALSALVRAAVLEEPNLSRYAELNRLSLTPSEQAALTTGSLDDGLTERAGPLLVKQLLARKDEKLRAHVLANVISHVRRQPVKGARWANSTGCGFDIEGGGEDERLRVACGMGFTPERSRRFLYFFKRAWPREGEENDD